MNLTDHLAKVMSDDKGTPSSMRWMNFLIIAVGLFNWTYINITTGQIASFEPFDLAALLGPLGFKSWQKSIEGKTKEK